MRGRALAWLVGLLVLGGILPATCQAFEWACLPGGQNGVCSCDTVKQRISCVGRALETWPRLMSTDTFQYRTLDLASNRLTAIDSTALATFKTIVELLIHDNRIDKLQNDAFASLPNLIIIELYQNPVTVIEPHLLRGIPKLQQLSISSDFMSLDKDFLQYTPDLEDLDLAAASLAFRPDNTSLKIHPAMFKHVDLNAMFMVGFDTIDRLVPSMFAHFTRLDRFGFSFSAGARSLAETPGWFDHVAQKIRVVDYTSINITEPPKFPPLPSLQRLSISGNYHWFRFPRTFLDNLYDGAIETDAQRLSTCIHVGANVHNCTCRGGTDTRDGTFCDYTHYCDATVTQAYSAQLLADFNIVMVCPEREKTFPGDTCTLVCDNDDLEMVGSNVATCTPDGWKSFAKCQLITDTICDLPQCDCYEDDDIDQQLVVECSSSVFSGRSSSTFPLLPATWELNGQDTVVKKLQLNAQDVLPRDTLFGLDLDALRLTHLNKEFHVDFFGAVPNLNFLKLGNRDAFGEAINDIQYLSRKQLSAIPNLQILNIMAATSFTLTPDSLRVLPNLLSLYLDHVPLMDSILSTDKFFFDSASFLQRLHMFNSFQSTIPPTWGSSLLQLKSLKVRNIRHQGSYLMAVDRVQWPSSLTEIELVQPPELTCLGTSTESLSCTCDESIYLVFEDPPACLRKCTTPHPTDDPCVGGDTCTWTCTTAPRFEGSGTCSGQTGQVKVEESCPSAFITCPSSEIDTSQCFNPGSPLLLANKSEISTLDEVQEPYPHCIVSCGARAVVAICYQDEWHLFNEDTGQATACSAASGLSAGSMVGIAVGVFILFVTLITVIWVGRTSKQRMVVDEIRLAEMEAKKFRIERSLQQSKVVMDELLDQSACKPTAIYRSKLELHEELGSGCFGQVHRGTYGKQAVAVKTLKSEEADAEEQAKFVIEAQLMSCLQHPNLVSIVGYITNSQPYLIVMELLENGDLREYLLKCRPGQEHPKESITPYTVAHVGVQLVSALEYLSERNIVHRDVACRNILVGTNLSNIKLSDYGMARYLSNNTYYRKVVKGQLPLRWMSPESVEDEVWTTQSDVWSFAVTMWEVSSLGLVPYGELDTRGVVQAITSFTPLAQQPLCPDSMHALLCQCWQESSLRPTFAALHPAVLRIEDECVANNVVVGGSFDARSSTPTWQTAQQRHGSATSQSTTFAPSFASERSDSTHSANAGYLILGVQAEEEFHL
eukprot:m.203906 g.203906  ORF g.203906 m.203906 type:complete len:1224 (+) comp14998_c0_seq9:193-3864(+)